MAGPNVEGGDGDGGGISRSLFQGKQFWLSQNIPQRSRFKELIEQNGGVIRLQEKDADIKVVDHTRKNLPSDTYSFKFIEDSVRNGKLADLEAYRAGPSASRPAGATHIPTRGHKIPYSLHDDQLLWDWLQPYEKTPRAPIGGNRIYRELAEKHPRHTWQSYRDRYLKRLRGRPRPGGMAESMDQTPAPQEITTTRTPVPDIAPAEPHERLIEKPPVASKDTEARKRKRSPETDVPNPTEARETNEPPRKKATPAILLETSTTRHTAIEKPIIRPKPVEPRAPQRHPNKESRPKGKERPSLTQPQPAQRTMDTPENIPDNFLLELPFFPSSPESAEEDSEQGDIDAWIDDRLRTGKAANEEQVIEALQCTSMDPHLADKVLGFLREGKAIPEDMPGVWTPEDDEGVEMGDTRAVERVLKKHGSESFEARWNYLSMARAVETMGES